MKNDLGVEVPVGTDAFDPQGDMTELGASLKGRIVVPVANKTERAAQATALAPSVDAPLIVFRADAGPGAEVEYTTNGTDWHTVAASTGETVPVAIEPGWTTLAANVALPPRVAFDGNLVRMHSGLFVRQTSDKTVPIGAAEYLCTVPSAYAPVDTVYGVAMTYSNSTPAPIPAAIVLTADGRLYVQCNVALVFRGTGGANNTVRITDMFWPRKP